jgi:hypothetical protein
MTRQVSEFSDCKLFFLCVFVIVYFFILLQISNELYILGNVFFEKVVFGDNDITDKYQLYN